MRPSRNLSSLGLNFASRRGWMLAAGMAAALALLGGCGGGGGDGVGTGGTGSFASGTVTGFGSVVVNAVRFDDSTARVEDVDGAARSRDDLRLGMTVEVESTAIVPATPFAPATSTATRIRVASEIVGAITAIDGGTSTLTVLGQAVKVDAATAYDNSLVGGFAALAVGRHVEIYAYFDVASASYRATRIEPESTGADNRLRGVVGQLETATQRFQIGTATFRYDAATSVPAGLANGDFVRLRLASAPDADGFWAVQSFAAGAVRLPDADEAKLKGLITRFASATSFSVNGSPVDATGASFEDGAAGLALGVRVEVEGVARNGVLVADEVGIESDAEEIDREYEIEGSITSVNSSAGTFLLRNVVIGTTRSDLRFDDGTKADLKAGARVEVKGQLSADGTRVDATRIKFE